jgi:ascorbate-specific PTS system EIIC-type component UlaA
MKKILLFVLSLFLGAIYSWSGLILPRIIIEFLPLSSNLAMIIFGITPWLLCIITLIYLILKKRNFVSIIGIILGFVIGFSLLTLGLGMGNV